MRNMMSVLVLTLAACTGDGSATSVGGLTIQTDSAAYTAIPVGYSQVVVKVRMTFRNAGTTPVIIERCGAQYTEPIYGVRLISPASSEGAAYSRNWACTGNNNSIVIEAGAARTDTLVLRGPNSYDAGLQKYVGVLEGRFRISYGGVESNEFEVRLPDGGVVPNVVRDLGSAIQTDSLLYHLHVRSTSAGLLYDHGAAPVRVTISNPRSDTSFIVTCNGQSGTSLERLQNGVWIPAWSDAVAACFGSVIGIPPNRSADASVYVGGGGAGASISPQFSVPYIPGVYRLVWARIVNGFSMGPPLNFGMPIPIEYRRSNPFAIVDP